MNKQEAIEKIKNLEGLTILDKTINFDSETIPKKEVFDIINQIDEQEKTVVPKFVADWYEECKDYFDFNIYGFYKYFYSQSKHEEVKKWLDNAENKAIETLVKMKLFGYEVEKEKRYTAKLKLTNEYLVYYASIKDLHHAKTTDNVAKREKVFHFTEDDLVKYHVWENTAYEVNEVR